MIPARFQDVHAYLEGEVAARKIAGAAVLVAEQGQTVYLDTLGMRDVEAGLPMTADTIFRICSLTKPVTCVGALMLVEQGRIGLQDPVSEYIPALANMPVMVRGEDGEYRKIPAVRPITIRDLFTHLSGLSYSFNVDDHFRALYRQADVSDGLVANVHTLAEHVARLAKIPLVHQPGERWTYSSSTDVLGHVIEVVSGQTLAAFLEEHVFAPLGMHDTGFRVAPENEGRLAAVYCPGPDQTIERMPGGVVDFGTVLASADYPLDRASQFYSGGGGLVSTVLDYARFATMLYRGGGLDGVKLLEPETVAMMTRDQIGSARGAVHLEGSGYGFGVAVVLEDTPSDDQTTYGSPGTFWWDGFYHTLFWVDPRRDVLGVAMTQIFPWDHLGMWPRLRGLVYAALDR